MSDKFAEIEDKVNKDRFYRPTRGETIWLINEINRLRNLR